MIVFENVSKIYDNQVKAVDNVNLHIRAGEFIVLIGPSGCGKTTTLEMINRLEKQTSGYIYVNGRNVNELNKVELRRNIGYVIQQTGLFPHLTIGDNIGLVPRLKNWSEERIDSRIKELLEMVNMEVSEYIYRFPHELSGGQQQRVGVLRALAAEPDIILMDEPFGALDPITRETLQDELKKLQNTVKKTVVFVTHDMDEALKLGDRVIMMKEGKVVQADSPEDLLRKPADKFVEEFIGRDKLATHAETLIVDEVMVKTPITASPDTGLAKATRRMRQKKIDSLLIVNNEYKLLGIITARDIQKHKARPGKVIDLLQRDIPVIFEGSPAKAAFEALFLGDIGILPVVDNSNELKGLVTRSSLAEMLYKVVWESNDYNIPDSNNCLDNLNVHLDSKTIITN